MTSPPSSQLDPESKKQNTAFWIERWEKEATRWDQKSAHPCLVQLLQSEEAGSLGISKHGKAFVPGCGTGYDVQALAESGYDTTGLEVSEKGVRAARQWLGEQPDTEGSKSVVQGDFFIHKPDDLYDVIYDYTFLCALEPPFRQAWASTIASAANPSSETRLITLMYPLNGAPGGPPFALSEKIYHDLLDLDWTLLWCKDIPEEYERKFGPRSGDSKIAVWGRKG